MSLLWGIPKHQEIHWQFLCRCNPGMVNPPCCGNHVLSLMVFSVRCMILQHQTAVCTGLWEHPMPMSYVPSIRGKRSVTCFDFSQHEISVWQTVIVVKPDCEKEGEGEWFRFIFVPCIKQGEMEGSAKYLELLHMAEDYFQQSVTKPER